MNKMKIAGLVGGALLLCGSQAQAEITWDFSAGGTITSGTAGNTRNDTSGGVTATAQAWANTNNGTAGTSNAALGSNTSAGAANYKLETAYLNVYGSSGLGVKNQDASGSSSYGDQSDGSNPEHSMDNEQRYDSILFSFNTAIDLNSVSIGWYSNDSDISVLRYDGTGNASNVSGKTYAQLLTSGWTLVSQAATSTATQKDLVGTTGSSYWLVGAANPLLGTSMDNKNDYVKLLALSGDKYTPPCTPGTPGCGASNGQVPEPGTLLLMGAGLFGLTRFNARRTARSAV